MNNQFAGKIQIVGVAWNGSEESMQDFVTKHQLSFANIKDNDVLNFAQFDFWNLNLTFNHHYLYDSILNLILVLTFI